ncbi:probable histone-lysine N-methyltransferase PRDM7 [Pelobates cultripes]|uniref:Probable histone-lysine N-methyltransferase PRDM7 n=1 Tax=Pelobates cultripes TaxID=61616 RepID=A0AAD1TJZ5_PELCU|nr:probable histone-lysine N-methyltransferase PRDM7 [Pelobates cultripes]
MHRSDSYDIIEANCRKVKAANKLNKKRQGKKVDDLSQDMSTVLVNRGYRSEQNSQAMHSGRTKKDELKVPFGDTKSPPKTQPKMVAKPSHKYRKVCISLLLYQVSKAVSENQGVDKPCSSTYSLRSKARKLYIEIEEPQDDDYLFCEECQSFFIKKCPVHGAPSFIQDSAVELGKENRAALTLPPAMTIKLSSIPRAGLGVWNQATILPKGTHFGPYEGVITEEDTATTSGYSWQVESSICRILSMFKNK